MKTLLKYFCIAYILFMGTRSYGQLIACDSVTNHPPSAGVVYFCKGSWVDLVGYNCGVPDPQDQYAWVNVDNPKPPVTLSTFATQEAGRWELTISNIVSGLIDRDTIDLRYYTTPPFYVNGNAPVVTKCEYTTITLTATAPGGTFNNYQWFIDGDPTPLPSTINTLDIATVPSPGQAYYIGSAVHITSGCRLFDTIYVSTFATPQPSLGADTSLCTGQSVILSPNMGSGTWQYSWNGGALGTTSTYTVSSTETVTVKVKGPFPNPCENSDVITVTVNPNPVVTTGPPSTICYGNNVVLGSSVAGAPGTHIFAWSPKATLNDSTLQTPTANPTSNTTYTLLVTVQETGCKGTATRTLNVNPQLFASVAFSDSTICSGDAIQLQGSHTGGTSPYTYGWSPNTSIINANTINPTVNPTGPVTYIFTVTDSKNCTADATVSIDMLWVDLGGNDTLALVGDSILLDALNASNSGFIFDWKDSTGASIGSGTYLWAKSTGTYTIRIINPVTLCEVTDSKKVLFASEIIQKIYVPSVFQPGMSDADNANLRVYGNNVSNENFKFKVFNSWGELIYETNNFDEANLKGWNGNLQNTGQAMNMGVYTYTVSGKFFDGTTFDKAGTSSLLR